jgi:CubicO group peptidase (beta-lactamase class C family)
MKIFRIFVLVTIALSWAPGFAADEAERVTALFKHLNEGTQPGAAVMVIRDGSVVYTAGFGFADLDKQIPIDANSTFRLASVSKQFTAMAIMVLADEGRLDYDDPVIKYIPELDGYPGVTIRHLLTHTSGLPDYYDSMDTSAGMPTNADIPAVIAAMNGPVFAPGEKYEYSNSAYEMLPLIIEKVSGRTFSEFMQAEVFLPAGMDNSLIYDRTEPEIANRAYGYEPDGRRFKLNDYNELNYLSGSGGMYATLEDFFAWDQALYGEDVVSSATLAEGFTSHKLNNGDDIEYGFGWGLDLYRGHHRIDHGGSWVGFRTNIARFPEEKTTIVVLTNRTDGAPAAYVEKIADIYLAGRGNGFRPSNTMTKVQEQMRRLPADDIWWTVNGKDMAWNFKNLHQIFPTVNVYRNGPVRELNYQRMPEIANHMIETPDGPMPFKWFIASEHSTAMGVVILHKGEIVFESYPRMEDYEKPVTWSVAKVMPATVLRILEERGELDVSKPINAYIPELAESSFAGISVRDILDMASGLDCSDEYTTWDACYYQYSMAIGDGFRTEIAMDNPYEFAAKFKATKLAEPGQVFSYSGLNTFILGWLVEKLTDMPFQDAFTQEIWHHIGAESDASYFAPRYGIAVTHGGFLSRMRDLARFGLLFTPSYSVVSDKQIISDEHIELLRNGGRPHLLANTGYPGFKDSGIKHNVYQWDAIYENDNFYKGGWAGQGLIVNPTSDVVAVFTSYFKDDAHSEMSLETAVFDVIDTVFNQKAGSE